MKCVIVAGGTKPEKDIFLKLVEESSLLIAADKGLEVFYDNNIVPDIIMGDFDSVNSDILDYYKNIDKIEFPTHKDSSDSALAVEKAIDKGAEEIFFLGATGTRLDHVFANIGLMKYSLSKGVRCSIIDKNNLIFIEDKSFILYDKGYKYFSLHALSECISNLSIKNAKYCLDDYELKLGDGSGLTVSNEFCGKPVEVDFDSGILIVFYSKD